MRHAYRIGLVLLLGSVSVGASHASGLDELRWLAGSWHAESGEVTMEEHWIPPSGGMMLSVSRVIADGKVVAFEFLRIEERDEGIFYVAQPNGRPGVEFRLIESSGESATFENPEHDHPKRFHYEKHSDGTLHVRVEGDEGTSEFSFQPRP